MRPLTVCDWEEIYSALGTKAVQLENGAFGESDEECNVERWAAHLREIMETIGEDGRVAAAALKAPECPHPHEKGVAL